MAEDWSVLSGSKVSRRTLLQFSAGTGALMALAACSSGSSSGQNSSSGSAGGQPKRGGSMTAAWPIDKFTSLDPQMAVGADQMSLLINVCEGLTRLTPNVDVEAALAESWKVSADGKTYTFKIRKGVTWHNGDDFTAHDMVYTYHRGADPSLGSPSAGSLKPVAGVSAPDDYTFVVKLKQPFAAFLTTVTGMPGRILSPVNKKALTQMGEDKYSLTPLGTGPFEITEHKVGDHVTLARYDKYWDKGYPLLDQVIVNLVPEPSTVQSALLSGDVQFAEILQPQSYAALAKAGNVQAMSLPGLNWWGLWMNYHDPKAPFLADHRVRLALAKAIDRKTLISKALFGQGDIGYGVYNLGIKWAYDKNVPKTLGYDLDGAKKLLSDADATGIHLSFMTNPGFQRTDHVIADMLSKAGVDVSVDMVETSVYSQRGYTSSKYQLLHSGSAADPDPDDSLYNYFDSAGAYNTYGYKNPKVDSLITDERVATDRSKRAKALWKLQDQLIADVATGFTYHSRDLLAMGKSVHGYDKIPELRSFRTTWIDR